MYKKTVFLEISENFKSVRGKRLSRRQHRVKLRSSTETTDFASDVFVVYFQNFQNGHLQKTLERTFPVIKSVLHQKCVNKNNINKNISGSNRSQMFYKIDVLKNLLKFKGKYCKGISFLLKLQVGCSTFLKKLLHKCFPANFAKFLRAIFFLNTVGRLHLHFIKSKPLPRNYEQFDWR